ncbi:MAG: hypothetical protein V3T05_03695, partial [Myxococcota bacterium]
MDPESCELLAGAACNNGRCSYLSRTCDLAPSPHCLADDATYRTYAPVGVCNAFTGLCEYVPLDTLCQDCTQSCLTQCSQVTCPPIADGCRLGSCVVQGGVSCQYADAADGAPCLPATGLLAGVCFAGVCVECRDATNCDDGAECTVDECDSSNQCV